MKKISFYHVFAACGIILLIILAILLVLARKNSATPPETQPNISHTEIPAPGIDSEVTKNPVTKDPAVLPNSISVSATKGTAPATFSFTTNYGIGDYWIDYGDGSPRQEIRCETPMPESDGCLNMPELMHTYTAAGTYTVAHLELSRAKSPEDEVIGTVTVIVE